MIQKYTHNYLEIGLTRTPSHFYLLLAACLKLSGGVSHTAELVLLKNLNKYNNLVCLRNELERYLLRW